MFETAKFRTISRNSRYQKCARTAGVVCERVEHLESLSSSMKTNRRGLLVKHLSGGELDQAIADAQKADETRLVRRLCYVKNR